MSQEFVDRVRRNHLAWNRGDDEAAVADLAPDVEWVIAEENPNAGTLRGRDAVRAYLHDWRETLDDMSYELERVVDAGDAIVTIGTISGRAGPAGPEVAVPLAVVSRLDGDLVSRVEEYLDPRLALEAVGLSG
jgi:ketosteroid isomerase-like protein